MDGETINNLPVTGALKYDRVTPGGICGAPLSNSHGSANQCKSGQIQAGLNCYTICPDGFRCDGAYNNGVPASCTMCVEQCKNGFTYNGASLCNPPPPKYFDAYKPPRGNTYIPANNWSDWKCNNNRGVGVLTGVTITEGSLTGWDDCKENPPNTTGKCCECNDGHCLNFGRCWARDCISLERNCKRECASDGCKDGPVTCSREKIYDNCEPGYNYSPGLCTWAPSLVGNWCPSGYQYVGGGCYPQCPDGYHMATAGICTAGIAYKPRSIDNTPNYGNLTCPDEYEYVNTICYDKCPDGLQRVITDGPGGTKTVNCTTDGTTKTLTYVPRSTPKTRLVDIGNKI